MTTSGKQSCAPSSQGSHREVAARLYFRLRALLCRAWGIPPWEFDEAAQAEKISFADASEAIRLEAIGTPLMTFLFPERQAEKRAKFEQVAQLVKRYERESDPDKKAALAAELTAANRW